MIGSTAAVLGLGALSAGGSIAGGLIGKGGADAAAGGMRAAGNQAAAAAQHQKDVNLQYASPYLSAGQNAISQIGALLGYGRLQGSGQEGTGYEFQPDGNAFGGASNALSKYLSLFPGYSQTFQADPGYQWRLSEGNKALDRSAASRGMLLSGAQAKALTDWNQNAASNEYGNWWQRSNTSFRNALTDVFNTANLGGNAASSFNATNSGVTSNANNALLGGASAAGNATMQGANALASGIGSGINNAMLAGYLGGAFGGRGTSYGSPNQNVDSVGGMPIGTYRR